MIEHGRVLAVTDETLGDYLDTAATASDTTLNLADASLFDEAGGELLLDDADGATEVVTYTAADPEADTLTVPALAASWAAGSRVKLHPLQTQRMAIVQLDDAELGSVWARVPYAMQPMLAEGIRDTNEGEEVLVTFDRGAWTVTDTLRLAPTVDGAYVELVADQVTADNIEAGSITADKLAAELVLASTFKTAATGQRVEIDSAGIRLIDASGTVLVDIPSTAGASATFRGDVTADSLTVDTATFTGSASFDTSSTNELKSAQADPATAPILTQGVASAAWDTGRSSAYFPRSPWYWEDNDDIVYLEGHTNGFLNKARVVNSSDGVLIGSAELDVPSAFYTHSIVYHEENDRWIGTARKYATGEWFLVWWLNSGGVPGAYVDRESITTYTDAFPMITKANGSGTMYVGRGLAGGGLEVRTYTWPDPAFGPVFDSSVTDTTPTNDFTFGLVAFWRGSADFGATRYVFRGRTDASSYHSDYTVTDTSLSDSATSFWPAEGQHWGVTYDTGDSAFREVSRDEEEIYTYAGWTESGSAENQYQVAYTWYDNAGTTHESALSPRAEVAHLSRRYVTVTWPGIPAGGADDPNSVRIYVIDNDTDQGATFANYFRQGTNFTGSSTSLASYSTATGGVRDTAFTPGTPAYIASQTGAFAIHGDGKLHLPSFATGSAPSSTESALYYDTTDDVVKVRNGTRYNPVQGFLGAKALKGANQTITAGAGDTLVTWSSTAYDEGSFFDNANDSFVVPSGLAGYYRVTLTLDFAASTHGNRNRISIRKNGTVWATLETSQAATAFGGCVSTVLPLVATDAMTAGVLCVSTNVAVQGSAAEFDTYFIIEYLGPGAAN